MASKIKTSKRCSTSKMRHAEKYWTKSRMRAAIPIPFPKTSAETLRNMTQEAGETRIVPPVLPRSAQKLIASTNEVGDMTEFPFSYVGKLFMREGDTNYVGSAWVIGDRAVFSAAHCMFDDNGTFFDDVVFQPQFRNGSSAIGSFALTQMSIDKRYAKFDDDHLNFDLAIGLLDRRIGHLTGIAGYVVNPITQIAIGKTVTGIGYPADPPFDGSKMFQSRGRIVRDSAPGTTTERFFGAENEMTGGCSGGPIIDESNIAVGLNSFVFVGEQPQIMHSPYFGEGFESLVEWGKENGGVEVEREPEGISTESCDCEMLAQELAEVIETLESIRDRIS